MAALKAWKIGCPKGHDGLVFPTRDGSVQDHAVILDSLNVVMRAAHVITADGEAKYGLHALRHFFASWCINPKDRGGRELPPKQVQTLLGHSSINMTLDVYGHLSKTAATAPSWPRPAASCWASGAAAALT
jgi:integrase